MSVKTLLSQILLGFGFYANSYGFLSKMLRIVCVVFKSSSLELDIPTQTPVSSSSEMFGFLLTLYKLFTLLVDVTCSVCVSSFPYFCSKLQAVPLWTKQKSKEQNIIDIQFNFTHHGLGFNSGIDFKLWQWVPDKTQTSFDHFEFCYVFWQDTQNNHFFRTWKDY